jgi:hypothetical protein
MRTNLAALSRANAKRWANARLTRNFDSVAKQFVALDAKARYRNVEAKIGVPWVAIAVIHERESSQDWTGSRRAIRGTGFRLTRAPGEGRLRRTAHSCSQAISRTTNGALFAISNGTALHRLQLHHTDNIAALIDEIARQIVEQPTTKGQPHQNCRKSRSLPVDVQIVAFDQGQAVSAERL